ncbi:MAG: hypothetical protein ACI9UO_002922 [Nitrospinales bacterium]|jgi:hypothetical protein
MITHWSIQTSVGEFATENALCAEKFEDLSIGF